MAVFLAGVTLVIAMLFIRRRKSTTGNAGTPLFVAAAVLGAIMLGVQSIRDYFLSGWLQYPLSLFSFTTPWTATDPVWNRTATLGNARNPADIWGSVDGYSWVGAWMSRLPSQWESYLVMALVITLISLLIISRLSRVTIHWRALALAIFPSAIAVLAWFLISPPSFRFGWGPLFSLLVIPIGVALHGIEQESTNARRFRQIPIAAVVTITVALIFVTVYSATVRLPPLLAPQPANFSLGSINLPYQATPVINVPAQAKTLDSGLVVLFPTESDQCWRNYPLCTPIIDQTVRLRGESLQQGFLP